MAALRAESGAAPLADVAGPPERDIFICHAGEDKDELARPLAENLRARDWRVWYDEFELQVGDSLREKIDEGLRISRFGAVILSPAFLGKKKWTERELDGLTTREVQAGSAEKVILPIWHGVTHEKVARYSPVLADRRAVNSARGLERVVSELESVLRSDTGGPPPGAATGTREAPSKENLHKENPQNAPITQEKELSIEGEPGTPGVAAYDEVVEVLRHKDEIGVHEALRKHRRVFDGKLSDEIEAHHSQHPDDETLLGVHDALLPVLEQRLGALLPLVLYSPELLTSELRTMSRMLEARPLREGYTAWPELADWATWWLGYACGAVALAEERWGALSALLSASFATRAGRRRSLVEPVRESVGIDIGRVAMGRLSDSRWLVARWEDLVYCLGESVLLHERWPELVAGEGEPRGILNDFDFLVSLARGAEERQGALSHWSMNSNGAVRLARRIRDDEHYRAQVADLLQFALASFDTEARKALETITFPQWNESDAIGVLLEGER
jgi:hypothetical protein